MPHAWTQLVTWSTKSDTFAKGQWLRGRLYERRCDLSPSGEKLVYFVAKHHLQKIDPSYSSAWTAISKPPYFTALGLWPNRGTSYYGGGLFTSEDHVQINSIDNRWGDEDGAADMRAHPKHEPPKRVRVSPLTFMSGDQLMGVRLVRDGWKQVEGADVAVARLDWEGRLERQVHDRRLELELGYGKARYALFEKRRKSGWEAVPFEGVGFADFDQAGRLVFTRGEDLLAAGAFGHEGLEERLIASFSREKPGRVLTPAHARVW